MVEVSTHFGLIELYNSFISTLPPIAQNFINLFLLVLVIVIYSVFIWKFYRFISTKNLLGLNLNKYNTSEHPFFTKFFAGIFYLVEYIIILPILIFFWFGVFTLFLVILAEESMTLSSILLITVTIIGAIRMSSYIPKYGENLAREIAKLLPFVLLAFFILNSTSLNFGRIIEHLLNIPNFLGSIVIYLLFIMLLEVILRIFDFGFSLFGLDEEPVVEE